MSFTKGTRAPEGRTSASVAQQTATHQVGVSYETADIVEFGDEMFYCSNPHTSATDPTAGDSGNWINFNAIGAGSGGIVRIHRAQQTGQNSYNILETIDLTGPTDVLGFKDNDYITYTLDAINERIDYTSPIDNNWVVSTADPVWPGSSVFPYPAGNEVKIDNGILGDVKLIGGGAVQLLHAPQVLTLTFSDSANFPDSSGSPQPDQDQYTLVKIYPEAATTLTSVTINITNWNSDPGTANLQPSGTTFTAPAGTRYAEVLWGKYANTAFITFI